MNRYKLVIAGLFLTMIAGCVSLSSESKVVPQVNGRLLNLYGEPRGGVNLSLDEQVTSTTSDGTFSFVDILEGIHSISIVPEDETYATEQDIRVSANVTKLTLYMKDDDNPIPNPGIELLDEQGDPLHWAGFATKGEVSSDARTGSYALLMDADAYMTRNPNAEHATVGWHIPRSVMSEFTGEFAQPGGEYTLSFYYKTEGEPKFRVGVERRRWNNPDNKEEGVKTHNHYWHPDSSKEWTYYEANFAWPHPDTHDMAWILVNFAARQTTEGKLWIDDVKLSKH